MRRWSFPVGVVLFLASPIRCAEDAEAPRVRLDVVVDASRVVPCTTDLGYTVDLTALRVAVGTVGFTVQGETHAWLDRIGDLLAPRAHAHPGHYAGGEVTGELTGRRVIDWVAGDGTSLGTATLIPGEYHGANLELIVAAEGDGLVAADTDDPIRGHGAYLAGTARRDGRTVTFEAMLDIPDPALIVGAPLDLVVDGETRATLGLAFTTIDPFEQDTVFDGLDFFALEDAVEGPLVMGPSDAAHNLLRRTLFTHDHFLVIPQEPE